MQSLFVTVTPLFPRYDLGVALLLEQRLSGARGGFPSALSLPPDSPLQELHPTLAACDQAAQEFVMTELEAPLPSSPSTDQPCMPTQLARCAVLALRRACYLQPRVAEHWNALAVADAGRPLIQQVSSFLLPLGFCLCFSLQS